MHPHSCKYFTGIQTKVCQQGIAYANFDAIGAPCWSWRAGGEDERQAICALFVLPTAEELRVDAEETERALTAWLTEAAARTQRGACVQCGTPLTATRQIGRCIYAEPCGCRVGQGTLRNRAGQRVTRLLLRDEEPICMEER